jgi:hypothetical protein
MKKVIFTFALFICVPVFADWKYIASENNSGNEFFLDFETLRKEGNLRRIWQVIHFKPDHQNGWVSMQSRMEFDCKNETVQSLTRMAFSDKFAAGKMLFKSDEIGTKSHIPPNSVALSQLEEVCKR